jgi:hypothetical protein
MAAPQDVVSGKGGDSGKGVDEVQVQMDLKGKDFHHPFTPYKIQEEFMETVYRVLEGGEGRVGILESPTGTVCELFILLTSGFCVGLCCILGQDLPLYWDFTLYSGPGTKLIPDVGKIS